MLHLDRIFCFLYVQRAITSRPALDPTQPPIQWVPGGSFPGSKAARAWSWPFSAIQCRGQRMRGAILPLSQYVFMAWCLIKHRDTFNFYLYVSVGIALGYGLDDRGSRVRFAAGAGNFYLHHRIQNGSGAHPASYPMGTRVSFPGDKAAGARSWPLTSI
jgi:hypothetical protein